MSQDLVSDSVPPDLVDLDARVRRCRRCEEAGYIPEARPVVMDGGRRHGIVLIGQAPGIVEHENGRPFGGRAGAELFRWLGRVGIQETEFRDRVYMGAVTRCFPGKNPSGGGDRRPSLAEIQLCRTWFGAVLATLQPWALLLVGTLAIDHYLRGRRLDQIIGQRFERDGLTLLPLPHPSGASRWLNDPAHRELLTQALEHVHDVWEQDIRRSHREGQDQNLAAVVA